MRASTVFAIALSLLVGLAAAAGAKYAGLFDKKTPPAPEKVPPVRVLVAKTNLFEDLTVTSDQVGIREIRPEEQEFLQSKFGTNWRDRLMPALVTAAHMRTPRQNILADQILFRDFFNESNLPETLSSRLEPGNRAVNVSMPKDKAGGGVIRVGEFVDVLLTTKVSDGDREVVRTACIARGCKIIMKRNNLWQVSAMDPDDKPLNFTLQANAYRAALIEYAQSYGQLSLQPTLPPTKTNGSFSDPTSQEYSTEDKRVEDIQKGAITVTDADLMRIFKITAPLPKPQPLPRPLVVTTHYAGVQKAGTSVAPASAQSPPNAFLFPKGYVPPVNGSGQPTGSDSPAAQAPEMGVGGFTGGATAQPNGGNGTGASDGKVQSAGYTFSLPNATGKECATCGANKKDTSPVVGKP